MPGGVRAPGGLHHRADHPGVRPGRPHEPARRARPQPLRQEVVVGLRGLPRGGRQGELGHQRGVRARRAHPDHGELHPLHRRRRVHPLPQQGLPAGGALLGQRPHPGGDREARLGQDGRGAQGRRLGDRLVLRRVPEVDHGAMGPLPARLHDGRGPEGLDRERERDRRGGVQPARRALRVGRLDPRQGARLQRAHAVLLRAGGHPHKPLHGFPVRGAQAHTALGGEARRHPLPLGPRGHLHRRRQVHTRAANGRRVPHSERHRQLQLRALTAR